MSRSQSPTLSHKLEYIAYRGFEQSLRLFSLGTTFKLGEFLGRIFHRLSPRRRRQVTRNLRFAFGSEKSPEEIRELTAQIFERTGANFLCSLKVPLLNDAQILKHLEFEGLEELSEVTRDSGIVMVSPHMGNWELLAQAVFLAGVDLEVGTHYRPLNNSLINAVVERRRKRRGLKLFAKKTSTHRISSFVREGGAMGILADQRVGSRGASCLFFGRPTTSSPLPHLLAKRGKGSLVSLSCQTIGTAQWRVCFRPIPEISAQACADSVEHDWRRSPDDVFWFEDRWRIREKNALTFLEKYKPETVIPRPLRVINLHPDKRRLPYPENLLEQEDRVLDFSQDNHDLDRSLRQISADGPNPVDIFLCPESHKRRVYKLSGKVLVLSPQDLLLSSNQDEETK